MTWARSNSINTVYIQHSSANKAKAYHINRTSDHMKWFSSNIYIGIPWTPSITAGIKLLWISCSQSVLIPIRSIIPARCRTIKESKIFSAPGMVLDSDTFTGITLGFNFKFGWRKRSLESLSRVSRVATAHTNHVRFDAHTQFWLRIPQTCFIATFPKKFQFCVIATARLDADIIPSTTGTSVALHAVLLFARRFLPIIAFFPVQSQSESTTPGRFIIVIIIIVTTIVWIVTKVDATPFGCSSRTARNPLQAGSLKALQASRTIRILITISLACFEWIYIWWFAVVSNITCCLKNSMMNMCFVDGWFDADYAPRWADSLSTRVKEKDNQK
jgi:hypothetical protein